MTRKNRDQRYARELQGRFPEVPYTTILNIVREEFYQHGATPDAENRAWDRVEAKANEKRLGA